MNRRLQNCWENFRETCDDVSYSSSIFAYCFPIRGIRVLRKKRYPLLGTSSSKLEISLLGRINQGGNFPSNSRLCKLRIDYLIEDG